MRVGGAELCKHFCKGGVGQQKNVKFFFSQKCQRGETRISDTTTGFFFFTG